MRIWGFQFPFKLQLKLDLMSGRNRSERAISSFFDRETQSMIKRHEKKGIPESAKVHVKSIAESGASTAVDVGSGPGSIAIELLKSGLRKVFGIDLSPQMSQYAEKRLIENGFDPSRFQFTVGSFLDFDTKESCVVILKHQKSQRSVRI